MSFLLAVSGARMALEPGGSYALGRASDSDVVVADVASSRRHARLTVGDTEDEVFLEDLGSQNGTIVNDERIQGRVRLEDRSRVQIGATLYLLCLSSNDESAEGLDSATVTMDRLSFGTTVHEEILSVVRANADGKSGCAGQLGSFSVLDVLQFLAHTRQSGALHIALEGGHAVVEICKGEVHAARYQDLEGVPALEVLARQESGIFWLAALGTPGEDTIGRPVDTLLFELYQVLAGSG